MLHAIDPGVSPIASAAMEDDVHDVDEPGGPAAAASERIIADRLDALEAEAVFHRALELEAEAANQPHFFTGAQIARVAEEIGMDLVHVRQALAEVRLRPVERTRFERFVLAEPIMAVETVEAVSRAGLDRLVEDWMRDNEGLVEVRRLDDGVEWDVDQRLVAQFRSWLTAGGDRVSRATGGDIAHRIHSLGANEHVIALQSRGDAPIGMAKAAVAVAALVFAVGTIAAISRDTVGFLQWLAASAALAVGVTAFGIIGARRWAKRVGRVLRRTLTAIVHQARTGEGRSRRRFGWRRR